MNDTRFSSAIHTLILISESETAMTSEQIAESVGTNASYIRKLTGLLKRNGILDSGRGISGFRLNIHSEELSLKRIYEALYETEHVHLFDLHQNPNDGCIVGRHIKPVLTELFGKLEAEADRALRAVTLADCIETMKTRIGRENK